MSEKIGSRFVSLSPRPRAESVYDQNKMETMGNIRSQSSNYEGEINKFMGHA